MNHESPSETTRQPQSAMGLMGQLRAGTDPAHRCLEAALDVASCMADRARYTALLALFHGIYAPLEEAMEARFPAGLPGIDWASRRKRDWLREDLAALGHPLPPFRAHDLPPLADAAHLWGCLYVLEGSTLGGQMIARMAVRSLGIGPDNGGRFFHGYGPETGARWRAFGAAAEASGALHTQIIASANATFAAFERHAASFHPSPLALS